MLRRSPPETSAGHLGRLLAADGHAVRLMSPEHVRPDVKARKNDDRDAEAIAEAACRPTMRFVELKSEAQADLQSLHRARERLVGARTALVDHWRSIMAIDHLRALLLERGVTAPQGRRQLERVLPEILADENSGPSVRIRRLVVDLRAEWQMLDERILALDQELAGDEELAGIARTDEAARRLATIGPINATALVAAVGDGSAFAGGREIAAWLGPPGLGRLAWAAWLGLVPRQQTTGGRPKLLGIRERGNRYLLRKNLSHGARSVLP